MFSLLSKGRRALVFGSTFVAVMAMSVVAWATPPTPTEIIGEAAEGLVDQLVSVFAALVPAIATAVAVFLGFSLALRWIRRSTSG